MNKVFNSADKRKKIRYVQGLVHENRYQNSLYLGQQVNGKKKGRGVWRTQQIHQHGDFLNDKIHGHQVQKLHTGTLTSGLAISGLYHGRIQRKWFTGLEWCEYEGIIENNQIHMGKLHKNKEIFYGSFRDGNPYHGCLISENYIFEGEFQAGQRLCGIRITKYDLYRGSLLNSQADGKGYIQFAVGNSYDGEFRKGYSNGFGIWITPNERCEGTWLDGLPHGKMFLKSHYYSGYQMFVRGKEQGKGRIISNIGQAQIRCELIFDKGINISADFYYDHVLQASGSQIGNKLIFMDGKFQDIDLSKIKYSIDNVNGFFQCDDTNKKTNHMAGLFKGYSQADRQLEEKFNLGKFSCEYSGSNRFTVTIGNTRESGQITPGGNIKFHNGMKGEIKYIQRVELNSQQVLVSKGYYQSKVHIDENTTIVIVTCCPISFDYTKQVYGSIVKLNCGKQVVLFKGLIQGNEVHGYGLSKTQLNFQLGLFASNLLQSGTRTFPNGDIYSGEFHNSNYNGDGTCIVQNGQCKLEGKWVNGYNQGYSTLINKNEKYKGQMITYFKEYESKQIISEVTNNETHWFEYQLPSISIIPETIISKLNDIKEYDIYIDQRLRLTPFLNWMENSTKISYLRGSFLYQFKQQLYYVGENLVKFKNAMGTYLSADRTLHVSTLSFKHLQYANASRISIKKSESGICIGSQSGNLLQDGIQDIVVTEFNDHKYVGQTLGQTKHGELTQIHEGTIYCGTWVNNLRDGFGVEIKPNGECYEGNWKNGLKSGKGNYIINKQVFQVECDDDQPYIQTD